ncbi:MAG: glycosyltransferase family 2 protein [Chitinophagaceae bacterium]|nr:MAG: glycosyltransferase family 2 protein [Chitinophagaceae bacterium]
MAYSSLDQLPFVSIITLNYNQADVTCEFLLSTNKLTYRNFEILVCDMASTEDPTLKIEKLRIPNTTVFLCGQNLGFAGGNNWGMRKAKGDFIFIVNNDTEVTSNMLEQLLQPFFDDNSIGVTCPKIKFFSNPSVIQYAGFNAMNMYTGRTTAVGDRAQDDGKFDNSCYTHGAHGCAMMLSREVIEKTGMFPEKFFLYYEEWDWSTRILRAGFKIYYAANATIYHKESMSVGKDSPLKTYYLTRNRILYIRRNSNFFQRSIFYIFYTLFALPKAALTYAVKGEKAHLKMFLKGIGWNLTNSSYSPV